jgi:hypothetical protein
MNFEQFYHFHVFTNLQLYIFTPSHSAVLETQPMTAINGRNVPAIRNWRVLYFSRECTCKIINIHI